MEEWRRGKGRQTSDLSGALSRILKKLDSDTWWGCDGELHQIGIAATWVPAIKSGCATMLVGGWGVLWKEVATGLTLQVAGGASGMQELAAMWMVPELLLRCCPQQRHQSSWGFHHNPDRSEDCLGQGVSWSLLRLSVESFNKFWYDVN